MYTQQLARTKIWGAIATQLESFDTYMVNENRVFVGATIIEFRLPYCLKNKNVSGTTINLLEPDKVRTR